MKSNYSRMGMVLLAGLSTVWLSACSQNAANSQANNTEIQPEAATGRASKQAVIAEEFMVAAATPQATNAGYDMLIRGGHVIDAAVAVQAMLTLTEPQSSGLGGGAFILYWDAGEERLYTIDAREKAPAAATPELFFEDGKPVSWIDAVVGGRSVGVPGAVRGLADAHERWGTLPWEELFTPTIELAEEGFEVSERLAMLVEMEMNPGLKQMPTAARYFYPNGEPLEAGSIKRNPELAQTLRTLANEGADAFYRGKLAEDMVAAVRTSPIAPGLLTAQDLRNYQSKLREPVCTDYREHRICGMGPPSSGGLTVLQTLGILAHTPIGDYEPNSVEANHYFTQASRLAFADRNRYIADTDFVAVPVEQMLAPEYLAARAKLIGNTDMGTAEPGEFTEGLADDQAYELPNTSHISIVDAEGNALTMTTSIEMGFGSTVMVNGYLLNNQLTDFSLRPEVDGELIANRVEGNKRPRSSMAPTMVFDKNTGDLQHMLGSPGGVRIINYVNQTLLGVLDWDLDMQEAIDLPRVSNLNGQTELEKDMGLETLASELETRGHNVQIRDLNSGLQGISILPDGRLLGGADPRRDGVARGN